MAMKYREDCVFWMKSVLGVGIHFISIYLKVGDRHIICVCVCVFGGCLCGVVADFVLGVQNRTCIRKRSTLWNPLAQINHVSIRSTLRVTVDFVTDRD